MLEFLKKPTLYIIIIIILIILLVFLKCCDCGKPTGPVSNKKSNHITSIDKKSVDSLKKISKEDLFSISRFGAGMFLAVGTNGEAVTTYNGGLKWTQRNSKVKNHLRGSAILNRKIMLAVGDRGTITRSTDSGLNWDSIPSGTVRNIKSVSFPDETNGIAVGDSGLVLKSVDAGLTWINASISPTVYINSVCFISKDTGWFAGNGGEIRKTTNFGAIWMPETTHTTRNLNCISFNNKFYGTAVGDSGTILKTTNGGAKWDTVVHLPKRKLKSVHRVNNVISYLVGDGIVIREDKGIYTTLDTVSAHKFNAVDPGPYISEIAIGTGGITMAMTTAACDDCNVNGNNDLMFIPPEGSETNWKVRLRVYSGYNYRRFMRFISPGYILENHAISGWTQYDGIGIDPVGITDADQVSNGNFRKTLTGRVEEADIDAITLDMQSNTTGFMEFILTPTEENQNEATGSFEFYFGECVSSMGTCGLMEQENIHFCHKITYYLALPRQQ